MWKLISRESLVPKWNLLPCLAQVVFQLKVQPEVENLLPLGALGLNPFNHPWTYQVNYIFLPSAINYTSSVQDSGRTYHRSIQTPNSSALCWMEVPWLPIVFNMLEDILCQCPIINNIIMHVLVDQVLKVVQSLYLTLWLLSGVHCSDKDSLPQSVRQWWGNVSIYNESLPTVLEIIGRIVC